MSWSDHTLLGQQVAAPTHYQPHILTGIPRDLGRAQLPTPRCAGIQQGRDDWHVFELSWLNPDGQRQVAMARLSFDAASPHLIESKSLKLYFNSLNFHPLASAAELQSLVQDDLSAVSGAPVQLHLTGLEGFEPTRWPGRLLDQLTAPASPTQVDAGLLALHPAGLTTEEVLISHNFRSNCPVTGQPDWASVRIRYRGPQWSHPGLLAYLLSYSQHCGFHEQCVEQIFADLWLRLQPEDLMVQANYTRRGGLDINPVRSNRSDWLPAACRLHRQ